MTVDTDTAIRNRVEAAEKRLATTRGQVQKASEAIQAAIHRGDWHGEHQARRRWGKAIIRKRAADKEAQAARAQLWELRKAAGDFDRRRRR